MATFDSHDQLDGKPGAGLRVVRPLDSGAFLRKVPQVTLIFWVIKILSTGMGETTSDYLVRTIDPVIAVLLGGVCFIAALILQLACAAMSPGSTGWPSSWSPSSARWSPT